MEDRQLYRKEGVSTIIEEVRDWKEASGSKRKREESVKMMGGVEQDIMSIQDLKRRKYAFSIIDDNKLQLINTCLGGTFAGKSVLRGTQSLCATLLEPELLNFIILAYVSSKKIILLRKLTLKTTEYQN